MVDNQNSKKSFTYTCNDYREEITLLGLRQKLQSPDLTIEQRTELTKEIARLEKVLGF